MEATAAHLRQGRQKAAGGAYGKTDWKGEIAGGRDECKIEGMEGRKMGEVKEAVRGWVFYVRAGEGRGYVTVDLGR